MTPEASVIVATYNRRAMVCEAIASVLAQSDVCFELIVIDDGSNDGTAEELDELAAHAREHAAYATVEILHNAKNLGVAAARNLGMARATTPLVALLDSDDLWAPAKLRRQADFMGAHPECVIAQTDEIWIRNGVRVNPGRRHRKHAGDIFIPSLRTCLLSPSAVIARLEPLQKTGGFDEDFAAAEDYDLWLRMLTHHEAGLIDEPLVTRRAGHAGQLSGTVPAIDRFRILALLKLLDRSDLCSTRRAAVHEVLEEKCQILAQGLARRGRRDEANRVGALAECSRRSSEGGKESLNQIVASIRPMLIGKSMCWAETPSMEAATA